MDRERERTGRKKIVIQSGVGAVANAVLNGLWKCPEGSFDMYTEVLQDNALGLVERGIIDKASTTSISLTAEWRARLLENVDFYKQHIVVRPQSLSNSGVTADRFCVFSMNTAVEADIYGNVNSTHVSGSKMINGIGGAADFSRDAGLSVFMTPSTRKDGTVSCIVPMVSHVDQIEHDVDIIVTENGLADLRGLAPKERAKLIIEKCSHPDYRDELREYFEKAWAKTGGAQTPHDLSHVCDMFIRLEQTGTMKR
jgi:succinyl-CoA:acetate CoA-transferase